MVFFLCFWWLSKVINCDSSSCSTDMTSMTWGQGGKSWHDHVIWYATIGSYGFWHHQGSPAINSDVVLDTVPGRCQFTGCFHRWRWLISTNELIVLLSSVVAIVQLVLTFFLSLVSWLSMSWFSLCSGYFGMAPWISMNDHQSIVDDHPRKSTERNLFYCPKCFFVRSSGRVKRPQYELSAGL